MARASLVAGFASVLVLAAFAATCGRVDLDPPIEALPSGAGGGGATGGRGGGGALGTGGAGTGGAHPEDGSACAALGIAVERARVCTSDAECNTPVLPWPACVPGDRRNPRNPPLINGNADLSAIRSAFDQLSRSGESCELVSLLCLKCTVDREACVQGKCGYSYVNCGPPP